MYADTRMTAERERNVRIVLYILKITRRKALWIEFLRVVPVVTMVMKNISVHHDARFGGNVEAAHDHAFVCHARDCWFWRMQAQSFLDCLFQVLEPCEVFVAHGTTTAKDFINFGHNSKKKRQIYENHGLLHPCFTHLRKLPQFCSQICKILVEISYTIKE